MTIKCKKSFVDEKFIKDKEYKIKKEGNPFIVIVTEYGTEFNFSIKSNDRYLYKLSDYFYTNNINYPDIRNLKLNKFKNNGSKV